MKKQYPPGTSEMSLNNSRFQSHHVSRASEIAVATKKTVT